MKAGTPMHAIRDGASGLEDHPMQTNHPTQASDAVRAADTNPMGADGPHGRHGCTARSKQTGERCRRRATPGRTVCHVHGGKSPKGIASPSFKTGDYSKYMPARLLDRYNEALNDPELTSVRHQIALLESRTADLLRRVDTGESGRLWTQIRDTWRTVTRGRDEADRKQAMRDLGALIVRGQGDFAVWREVAETVEAVRRLKETERRRLVDMQQMITAEDAMAFATALGNAVRRYVTDPDTLRRIADDMTLATGRRA